MPVFQFWFQFVQDIQCCFCFFQSLPQEAVKDLWLSSPSKCPQKTQVFSLKDEWLLESILNSFSYGFPLWPLFQSSHHIKPWGSSRGLMKCQKLGLYIKPVVRKKGLGSMMLGMLARVHARCVFFGASVGKVTRSFGAGTFWHWWPMLLAVLCVRKSAESGKKGKVGLVSKPSEHSAVSACFFPCDLSVCVAVWLCVCVIWKPKAITHSHRSHLPLSPFFSALQSSLLRWVTELLTIGRWDRAWKICRYTLARSLLSPPSQRASPQFTRKTLMAAVAVVTGAAGMVLQKEVANKVTKGRGGRGRGGGGQKRARGRRGRWAGCRFGQVRRHKNALDGWGERNWVGIAEWRERESICLLRRLSFRRFWSSVVV